jgi:hypothetical protein
MPTSNGQIGRYDIRRGAVDSTKIMDEAVTTAKIPDLAVTFPDKIDDPIWSSTFYSVAFHNASLTTTETTHGTATFDAPAWVDEVSVFAVATVQMTNSSGGSQTLIFDLDIATPAGGGLNLTVPDSSTLSGSLAQVASLIGVAGSTVTVSLQTWLNTGTNSANFGIIGGIVVGTR